MHTSGGPPVGPRLHPKLTPCSVSPYRRAEILPKEEGVLPLTSSGRFWIQEPHIPFGWECDDLLVI